MKVDDLETLNPRILLIGDYGSGKTHTIGLIHKALQKKGTDGIYLFDFDHGAQTLKTHNFGDIEMELCVDMGRGPKAKAFETFLKGFSGLERDMQSFGGVSVDSLTTLQEAAKKYVQKINQEKNRQLGFMMSQNDWGVLIEVLTQMFPQMLRISHRGLLVMTAHLQVRQDEITSKIEQLPAVYGRKLPSSIGLWFNEVWALETEERKGEITCYARTRNSQASGVRCKTQTGNMPSYGPVEDAIEALMAYVTTQPKDKEAAEEAEAEQLSA